MRLIVVPKLDTFPHFNYLLTTFKNLEKRMPLFPENKVQHFEKN